MGSDDYTITFEVMSETIGLETVIDESGTSEEESEEESQEESEEEEDERYQQRRSHVGLKSLRPSLTKNSLENSHQFADEVEEGEEEANNAEHADAPVDDDDLDELGIVLPPGGELDELGGLGEL